LSLELDCKFTINKWYNEGRLSLFIKK
jgi:hypothetical protein